MHADVQSEAKRFMTALEKRCQLVGSSEVSVAQLHAIGGDINLTVPSMEAFIEQLNEAGTTVLFTRAGLCMSHPIFSRAATLAATTHWHCDPGKASRIASYICLKKQ